MLFATVPVSFDVAKSAVSPRPRRHLVFFFRSSRPNGCDAVLISASLVTRDTRHPPCASRQVCVSSLEKRVWLLWCQDTVCPQGGPQWRLLCKLTSAWREQSCDTLASKEVVFASKCWTGLVKAAMKTRTTVKHHIFLPNWQWLKQIKNSRCQRRFRETGPLRMGLG